MPSCYSLSSPWNEEEQRTKSSTSPPGKTQGYALGMTWLVLTFPAGLVPGSFPSLSGVLPTQTAPACFRFLEHLRLTSPRAPLPQSSHCLECSLSPCPAITAQFPPTQLNHTSLGRPGCSDRSALLVTHSCSSCTSPRSPSRIVIFHLVVCRTDYLENSRCSIKYLFIPWKGGSKGTSARLAFSLWLTS